jgi:hypothetical protein
MDTYFIIGDWAVFFPPDGSKPLRGRILRIEGVMATLDLLSHVPTQRVVEMTSLVGIRQPKPNKGLPEYLLNEAEKRSLLPRDEQEPWEREMHDYFENMTQEQFDAFLEETNYEFYSKIRHPVFSEAVIAYPVIQSKKKNITGRLIDGDDWQPTTPGDGLIGQKRGEYWRVTTNEEATHTYIKHFYPSFCENLPEQSRDDCPMISIDIVPIAKTP